MEMRNLENTTAKVSICIPTYNHAHFLQDAIGSALAQTYQNLELVVVDNCSTDNTARLVQEYAARDARVHYVRNQINIGAQNNLNRCIELASGEYILILCADDLLAPTALQKLVQAFYEHPEISLAGCSRLIVDKDLRPLNAPYFSRKSEQLAGTKVIRKCLRNGNLIGEPSSVLFRKRDAERGFDTRYRQLIDLEMWFHLLQKGWFSFIPEQLCKIRRHDEQQTKSNLESLSVISDGRLILNEYVINRMSGGVLLQHGWRMQIAFDIWAQQFFGMPFLAVNNKIREIYPLPLFYLLLPFKTMTKLVPFIKSRMAAVWR